MRTAFTPGHVGRRGAEEPDRHVPDDPQQGLRAGPRPDRRDGDVLRAASRRRTDHHRRHPAQRRRPGLPEHPGPAHTDAQIAGRRKVTDAVHAEGGVIYAQLMHTGRVGHPTNYRSSHHPVGPSPVKAEGRIFTQEGLQDFVVPRGLDVEEIGRTTGVPPLATGLASPSRSSRPWSRRSATTAPPCASRRRTRSTTSRRRLSRRPTVTWSPG